MLNTVKRIGYAVPLALVLAFAAVGGAWRIG